MTARTEPTSNDGQAIELRRSWRQILVNVFMPTTVFVLLLVLFSSDMRLNTGTTFLGVCLTGYFQLKSGIRLGETEARVRKYGTTFVPRSDIESIDVVPGKLGSRRIALGVRNTDEPLVLLAPWTGPLFMANPSFDQDVQTLNDWWLAHRSPG